MRAFRTRCACLVLSVLLTACARKPEPEPLPGDIRVGLREDANKLQQAEARFIAGLPAPEIESQENEHAEWFADTARHCKLQPAKDIEAALSADLDISQALCLRHFVNERKRAIGIRTSAAREQPVRNIAVSNSNISAGNTTDGAKAGLTVGSHVMPPTPVPTGRFAAFYLRSGAGNAPPKLVATDTVDEVTVNYPWSDFHGIKSEDFEGYWIGQFNYTAPTAVTINISQSWSRTRVLIDKKLVIETSSNAAVPYEFSAGTHLIEVEYINNWHTTTLSVTFGTHAATIPPEALAPALRKHTKRGDSVLLAAAYESSAPDNAIYLDVQPSRTPVVLVLSSYETVKWIVLNPLAVKIRAIVVASYSSGARVQTAVADEKVPRIFVKGQLGEYTMDADCSCAGGTFHCEHGDFADSMTALAKTTGLEVQGFAGDYSPTRLSMPAVAWNAATRRSAIAVRMRQEADRKACLATTRFR